jgi:CRISPR/Cas system-associated endonuclease Cas3-HD
LGDQYAEYTQTYLPERINMETVNITDKKLDEDFSMPIKIDKKENFKEWLTENSRDIAKGRYDFNGVGISK